MTHRMTADDVIQRRPVTRPRIHKRNCSQIISTLAQRSTDVQDVYATAHSTVARSKIKQEHVVIDQLL